jgi:hypothetical protein
MHMPFFIWVLQLGVKAPKKLDEDFRGLCHCNVLTDALPRTVAELDTLASSHIKRKMELSN